MNIVVFEMGVNNEDVQHQMVEFEGTLEEYVSQTRDNILADAQLDLLGIKKIDEHTFFVHYFSCMMEKAIHQYAFAPKTLWRKE